MVRSLVGGMRKRCVDGILGNCKGEEPFLVFQHESVAQGMEIRTVYEAVEKRPRT